MTTSVEKTKPLVKWYYLFGILASSFILIEKGGLFIRFLTKECILAYNNGQVLILPLASHHEQFRWATIIVGVIGILIVGITIYRYFKHDYDNEYLSLIMFFILVYLMLLGSALSALSTPLSVILFILTLAVPTSLAIYFTYIILRVIWLNFTESI